MITDGVEVVHESLSIECWIFNKVRGHIQAFNWEIDLKIYFTTAEHSVALMRESFEVDDKELWRLVNLHLLERRYMVFAL